MLFRSLRHSHRRAQSGVASTAAVNSHRQSETHAEPRNELAHARKPLNHEDTDGAVRMVNYQTNEPAVQAAGPISTSAQQLIELESDTPITAASLRLQPGAIVRGKDQARPTIIAPPGGMVLTADYVRFENIDFLWRPRSAAITSLDECAIIDQRAAHTEFVGCTFQALQPESGKHPAAIRVSGLRTTAALAPSAEIKLDRCVIDGSDCAIDCSSRGPARVEIHNSLSVASGPLIRQPTVRLVDAPVEIDLEHVTVRSATSVLEINCDGLSDSFAQIGIVAKDCVFALSEEASLVACRGRLDPSKGGLLKAIEWSDQGSLVTPQIPLLCWRHGDQRDTLSDDDFPLEGLVASAFEFTGAPGPDATTSQLRKWLAPLLSEEAPGIGSDLPRLPEPK